MLIANSSSKFEVILPCKSCDEWFYEETYEKIKNGLWNHNDDDEISELTILWIQMDIIRVIFNKTR